MKIISIIIATYNAEATLKTCLDSITTQLTEDTELLVIDGKSTDSTCDIIDDYKEKITYYISEKDGGVYEAWNKGIEKAAGKWIMFVGADDFLLPNSISFYINYIKNSKEIEDIDYICANNQYINCKGMVLKVLGEEPTWKKMKKQMVAAHVASLHNKKNLFERHGLYNLNFKICADYELLLRRKNKLNYIFIPKNIAKMKEGGISFSVAAIKEIYQIRQMHQTIPTFYNIYLYYKDLFAFKTFTFRKSLKRQVNRLTK